MAFDDVEPKYGKEHDLIELRKNGGMFSRFRNFKGIYLGFNSVETPQYLKTENAEGHVFLTKSLEKNVEIYHQRKERLKETWMSEGYEGVEWPEGIRVSKFKKELKKSEVDYLLGIFNKYNKEFEKAA